MLDEMQQQMRSEIIGKFGLAQAQRLGLIASHSVRLDAREVRLEAEGTVRDDNLRIRLDGDSTKEQRDFEERIATMGCRTDGQRAGALKKLEREREQSAWLERFTRERWARENQRRDSATSEEESVKRMEWRLRNQWRPDYDAKNYDREKGKA